MINIPFIRSRFPTSSHLTSWHQLQYYLPITQQPHALLSLVLPLLGGDELIIKGFVGVGDKEVDVVVDLDVDFGVDEAGELGESDLGGERAKLLVLEAREVVAMLEAGAGFVRFDKLTAVLFVYFLQRVSFRVAFEALMVKIDG